MERRLHGTGVVLLLLVLTTQSFAADPVSATAAPCDPWAAKVASIQGDVQAKRSNQADWQTANLNEIYCPGDQIRVGDNARAAIVLNNETLVRLDQNSAITLTEINRDGPSLLEMLEGIAHFISRVPRSLKINTPFVNAAIEGTEFVVNIGKQQTEVTVFEGVVLAQNDLGEVRVTQNETALARAGTKPEKILKVTPRNAVQWAMYFPPIFAQATGKLAEAQQWLFTGQVDKARAALKDETSAEALSLLAIIDVVDNKTDAALKSATDAVAANPTLAAAHIAQSYAYQANRELPSALASAQQAAKVEPDNALAWARIADLQLSTGELDDAFKAAQEATRLNPNLSRTQTILGFAYLLQIKIDEAQATFNKAIELDQVDPLPRLGLGLAKIRKNHLAEGRRDVEIAASLDPNSSIIRSYLGKAYYEEKRAPLDAEQYAMAKELDPKDPTPWLYDAIRRLTENDPVGALKDINQSIALNDNRAVYRSSLQLDQDAATRSVNQARIYQDLGFAEAGILEATNSLQLNPDNYSAHRFLADSYSTIPGLEIARDSEILQSQLLQPLTINTIQPELNQSGLGILNGTGPDSLGLNDLNALYTRDIFSASLSGLYGGNNTWGDEVILSGINDSFGYSLGQFHYETDGYRINNDLKHDIYSALLQYQISTKSSIQLEGRYKESSFGDRTQRYDGTVYDQDTRSVDTSNVRLGYSYDIENNSKIIFSSIYDDEKDESHNVRSQTVDPFPDPFVSTIDIDTHQKGTTTDIQYIVKSKILNIISGVNHFDRKEDINTNTLVTTGGLTIDDTTDYITDKIQNNNYYLYSNLALFSNVTMTLGASYDDFNSQTLDDQDQFNPKFGLVVKTSNTTIRLAAFRTFISGTLNFKKLEPTQIAGFNQFFDNVAGTQSDRYAFGIDYQLYSNLQIGAEITTRDLTSPPLFIISQDNDAHEILDKAYLYYTFLNGGSLSMTYIFDKYESDLIFPQTPKTVRSQYFPIQLKYHFTNGMYSSISATAVDQDVYISGTDYNEFFWNTDFSIGYLLPKRLGSISLLVTNIFNEDFNYQDNNFRSTQQISPLFEPTRTTYLTLNLNL